LGIAAIILVSIALSVFAARREKKQKSQLTKEQE